MQRCLDGRIGDLVYEEFAVDPKNSVDKGETVSPDQLVKNPASVMSNPHV
jgi:hypothetical protein